MELLTVQIVIAFIFGLIFLVTMLVLAIKFPQPTIFQYNIFRITFSLSAAGVAAMVPGFINLDFNSSFGLLVRAGGALAIFVIVFFFNPAQLRPTGADESHPPEQVAAVCYKFDGGSIEYLLVRTTGGRWTFPKGNADSGEERWFASQREACEESGAIGEIEHEPFTQYLHEKKEWKKKGIEFRIDAYLLKVDKTQKPEEDYRTPTWFSASAAEDALAEGRQFKYAEELRRVVREANKLISSKQIV